MCDATKYFRFLGSEMNLDLLERAKVGLDGYTSLPGATKYQFYKRVATARKLGLVRKQGGLYKLTAFGDYILKKVQITVGTVDWMFRAIDAVDDEEVKLKLIHKFFNDRPDIIQTLEPRLPEPT